jgi:hypothetical protein
MGSIRLQCFETMLPNRFMGGAPPRAPPSSGRDLKYQGKWLFIEDKEKEGKMTLGYKPLAKVVALQGVSRCYLEEHHDKKVKANIRKRDLSYKLHSCLYRVGLVNSL